MLQARSQRDAHEINQLNIEKSEIQMPYVKQLTEQKVAQNELAIEEAGTRNKYLERNLQQREAAADLSISAAQDQEKTRQRQMRFDESLAEVLQSGGSPRDLRAIFPAEYMAYAEKFAASQLQGIDAMQFKLKLLDKMPTDAGKSAYWEQSVQEMGVDLPESLQTYSPEGVTALKQALRERGRTLTSEILNEIEWYSDPTGGNDPAMARRLLDKLDQLGRSGIGSTKSERDVERQWGWVEAYGADPKSVDVRYGEINERLEFKSESIFKDLISASAQERLLYDEMSLQQIKAEKGPEVFYETMRSAELDAFETLSSGDKEFYMWAKRGRDAQTMPSDERPEVPDPPADTAQEPKPKAEPETVSESDVVFDARGMPQGEAQQRYADLKDGEWYMAPNGVRTQKGGGGASAKKPAPPKSAKEALIEQERNREGVQRSREQVIEGWWGNKSAEERARQDERKAKEEADRWWNSLSEEEKEQYLRDE
jgi:hypothetical protein